MRNHDEVLENFAILRTELRKMNQRLLSIESWLAALSKGKDLGKSHQFAHDMTSLAERINPTLPCDIIKDEFGHVVEIRSRCEIDGQQIIFKEVR